MIQFTKVCPHCNEEYWESHECEGTRREAEELLQQEQVKKNLEWLESVTQRYNGLLTPALNPWPNIDPVANKENDAVNNPKHYTSHPSGVECIDVTKHYNFQVGNAMKYLWRQGLKDEVGLDPVAKQIQDCEKAIWYIQSYINDLKGK